MYLLIQDRRVGSFILINNSNHQCNNLGPKIQILSCRSLIFTRNVLFLTLLTRSRNMQKKRLNDMTLVCHCQMEGLEKSGYGKILRSCEPKLLNSGFHSSLNDIPQDKVTMARPHLHFSILWFWIGGCSFLIAVHDLRNYYHRNYPFNMASSKERGWILCIQRCVCMCMYRYMFTCL